MLSHSVPVECATFIVYPRSVHFFLPIYLFSTAQSQNRIERGITLKCCKAWTTHKLRETPNQKSGPRQYSRYSDSLRAGRSGDLLPVWRDFPTRRNRSWSPPSLLYNEYRVSIPGVKRPGRGVNHTPLPIAKVKEIIQLYL
jgi:hypothetical protein